jgi:lysophospholipase L1-like esterase
MPVILTFGDSNTHGSPPVQGQARLSRDQRWPCIMHRQLGEGWHLVEEGHGGRTTVHEDPIEGRHKNGIAALPLLIESHSPIDVITIMLGTNDLKSRFSLEPEDIAQSIGVLVQCVRTVGAAAGHVPRILIIAPPPILETGPYQGHFRGGAAKSARLGPLIATIAAAQGTGFLDAGTVIESSRIDGIHFDEVQHGKLGKAVAAAVLALSD